jgi:hypothetical protein
VYLGVYLPQEFVVLGTDGPWTEEYSWDADDWGRWRPRPKMDEQSLLSWVSSGSKSESPSGTFPTDGRLYLYSALRPLAPEEGALELATMKANWLHGLMFVVVVLGGVLLWPARTAARSVAVGALVIALVLCGVFVPTFSRQVLNGVLAAAIVVVVVLWLVEYMRHRPPRRPVPASPSSPAAPPPATPDLPPVAWTPAPEAPAAAPPAPGSEEGGATHA